MTLKSTNNIPETALRALEMVPQASGSTVHNPEGTVFGIATPDGHSVLLTAGLARRWAFEILLITLPPALRKVVRELIDAATPHFPDKPRINRMVQ